jgi:hypothetical protein
MEKPMTERMLNRRDLNRLAVAAFGGLMTGALGGCGPADTGKDNSAPADKSKDNKEASAAEGPPLLHDPHVCRGINTCKNKGKKGTENECAGQGHCATAKVHSCQGQNDCKGQGGCGEHPGENECKGQGACAVPLDTGKKMTWQKARKHFEELMTKAMKKFSEAPDS